MKGFSRFILVSGIAVVWIALTVDSFMAKDTLYREFEYDASSAPIMSLSLRRLFERRTPFLVELANGDYAKWQAEELAKAEQEKAEAAENAGNAEPADATAQGTEDAAKENEAALEVPGEATGEAPAEETTPEATEEPVVENYVMTEVPDSYFEGALFIGDSRTVGLSEYCEQLKDVARFYSKISLTIYDFGKKEFVEVPVMPETPEDVAQEGTPEEVAGDTAAPEGEVQNAEPATESVENAETVAETADVPEDIPMEKVTIEEALSREQFNKIYIMLGINELGSGSVESFCTAYGDVVNRIRELQPDAIIYIQGIMHVTGEKSNKDKVFKNENINVRNEGLKALADNQHVFYIDMNEATDDEAGNLKEDLSFDNVHLKAKSYALWYDYLKTHAYVKESEYLVMQAKEKEVETQPTE